MNKQLKTVIFDMDGVIVDTEPVHHYAYFQHFDELNITVTEEMFTSLYGEFYPKYVSEIEGNLRFGT
jgi:beta-phosphoglucomutase-like phosphatase (HAD superfamily)